MGEAAYRFAFTAMGGACEILLHAPSETVARLGAEAGMEEVRRIEQKYSRYRPDSIITRVNQAAGTGQWLDCDAETRWLFDYADTLYRSSDGLFDITSGVLRRAWDFNAGVVPDAAALAALLPLIGWLRVERHGNRMRLPGVGMEIDLGGIGKEYAADSAAAVVARREIRHGYVNLGGDIRVIGPQPDGRPWLIAIQDPRQRGQVIATIPMSAGGLATSGDYEKYFIKDGRRYCHVLDPRTGMPVTYWRSVSVTAPMAVVAGSHSTIAMLKGKDALPWLQQSGLSYLAQSESGEMFHSQ